MAGLFGGFSPFRDDDDNTVRTDTQDNAVVTPSTAPAQAVAAPMRVEPVTQDAVNVTMPDGSVKKFSTLAEAQMEMDKMNAERPQLQPLNSTTSQPLSWNQRVSLEFSKLKGNAKELANDVSNFYTEDVRPVVDDLRGGLMLAWESAKQTPANLTRMAAENHIDSIEKGAGSVFTDPLGVAHQFNTFREEEMRRRGMTDAEIKAKKSANKTLGQYLGFGKPEDVDNWAKERVFKPLNKWAKQDIKERQEVISEIAESIDNPLIAAASQGIGSTLSALAVGAITRSPAAAVGLLTAVESSDVYNEARDAGKQPKEAAYLTMASASGTALLEAFGLSKLMPSLFGKVPAKADAGRSFFGNIARNSLFESGQEITQSVWQNLVEKYGYNKARNLMDGWLESAVGGAFGGAFGGALAYKLEKNAATQQIAQEAQQELELDAQEAAGFAAAFENAVNKTYANLKQGDTSASPAVMQAMATANGGINPKVRADAEVNVLLRNDVRTPRQVVRESRDLVLLAQDAENVQEFVSTAEELGIALPTNITAEDFFEIATREETNLITESEARRVVQDLAGDLGVDVQVVQRLTTPSGKRALGKFVQEANQIVIAPLKGAKGKRRFHKTTPFHEVGHLYFRTLLTQSERRPILNEVRDAYGNQQLSNAEAEERLVQDLQEYQEKRTARTKKYGKVLARILEIAENLVNFVRGEGRVPKFFQDVLDRQRPSQRKLAVIREEQERLSEFFPEFYQTEDGLPEKDGALIISPRFEPTDLYGKLGTMYGNELRLTALEKQAEAQGEFIRSLPARRDRLDADLNVLVDDIIEEIDPPIQRWLDEHGADSPSTWADQILNADGELGQISLGNDGTFEWGGVGGRQTIDIGDAVVDAYNEEVATETPSREDMQTELVDAGRFTAEELTAMETYEVEDEWRELQVENGDFFTEAVNFAELADLYGGVENMQNDPTVWGIVREKLETDGYNQWFEGGGISRDTMDNVQSALDAVRSAEDIHQKVAAVDRLINIQHHTGNIADFLDLTSEQLDTLAGIGDAARSRGQKIRDFDFDTEDFVFQEEEIIDDLPEFEPDPQDLEAAIPAREMSPARRALAENIREKAKLRLEESDANAEMEVAAAVEGLEAIRFADPQKEAQYGDFVRLVRRARRPVLDMDIEQIKRRYPTSRDMFNPPLAESDSSDIDILDEFKDRYEEEVKLQAVVNRPTRRQMEAKQKQDVEKAMKKRATRGKAGSLKANLSRTIKGKPTVKTVNERQLLRDNLRAQQRASLVGARAAAAEARTAQQELAEFVSSRFPQNKELARIVRTVSRATDQETLNKAINQMEEQVQKITNKQLKTQISDRLKNLKKGFTEGERVGRVTTRKKILAEVKEVKTKTKLQNRITRELKTAAAKKQGGKPVGKFTPRVQKVLDEMRRVIKLSEDEAADEINANLAKYEGAVMPDDVVLQNRILGQFSNLKGRTNSQMEDMLTIILDTKANARLARELEKFNREELVDRWQNKAIEQITGGAGLDPSRQSIGITEAGLIQRLKAVGKDFVGFNDVMDMLSFNDKTTKAGEGFLNRFGDTLSEENAESLGLRTYNERLRDMFFEAYEITTDSEMADLMHEHNVKESLGDYTNKNGITVALEFSRAEARKRWMELQDPTLTETFTSEDGMAYTPEMIEAIRGYLTDQDIAFAKAQLEFYRDYYNGVNEVYEQMYGVSLPKNENYSPISREDITRDLSEGFGQFGQEISTRSAVVSGSLKTRVRNLKRIAERSDVQVVQQHVNEMEHFKSWARKVRDLNSVFGSSEVRAAIKQEFGQDIIGLIDKFLKDFTGRGFYNAENIGLIDKWRINFTRAALSIKPAIMVKQLVSFVAFADDIPVTSFVKGELDFWSNPIKHAKILREGSELLKARGKNMERDIRSAVESDQYKAFRQGRRFLDSLMLNVQMGDQGAILVGGWAVYKHHLDAQLKAGKSQEEAHQFAITKFEQSTKRAQQSSAIADLSRFQRGGSIAKLFTMFLSSPNQYFRKELGAIRNLAAGRTSWGDAIKTIAIYHLMLPMLFQFVSDFGQWNWEQQRRAMILGSFNGIFIFGDALDYILRSVLGMRVYDFGIAPLDPFKDIGRAFSDITTGDFMNALRNLNSAAGSFTGVPSEFFYNFATGVNDVVGGAYLTGFAKLSGWSPYSLKTLEENATTTSTRSSQRALPRRGSSRSLPRRQTR